MAEEAKQDTKQEEKQANCLACSKPIKKIKRYYRNGKYFCMKKCWLNYLKKAKEETAEKK